MKKNYLFIFFLALALHSFGQNEETHEGRVVGSFDLGLLEVTSIYDETTGCERRTSPHSKHLFNANEQVYIRISESEDMAEVTKPSLTEKVYTSKECMAAEKNQHLTFNEQETIALKIKLDILEKALLDLTKNISIREAVRELANDENSNEKVYISDLEQKLNSLNINLLDALKNSLARNGGSSQDLISLEDNYKKIDLNGRFFNTFIFIPFIDEVDYDLTPIISKTLNEKGVIKGSRLNQADNVQSVNITLPVANENQVWIISMSVFDDSDIYPALPWQQCHCSRDTTKKTPEGTIILTRGKCSKNGTCGGNCGRANIWGDCPDTSCPGC